MTATTTADERAETDGATDDNADWHKECGERDENAFLRWVDPATPLDQLGERWREYRRRQALDSKQADLSGWSE